MVPADLRRLTPAQKEDFLQFEGNAQTLRTVSRLQVVKDARGLNLTFGTLAALMKYTVGSTNVLASGGSAARKKVGFFCSERDLVNAIHSETGLSEGLRHPLTYIMEACDDIAYSIIDAEDAVKKQIVSFPDLMFWIKIVQNSRKKPMTER
jgi:dGTPase